MPDEKSENQIQLCKKKEKNSGVAVYLLLTTYQNTPLVPLPLPAAVGPVALVGL